MYVQHPDLPEVDKNQIIWHYYSLPKFLSLISSSSLYFCRQDKFDDSFEGKVTLKDKQFIDAINDGFGENVEKDTVGCPYSCCWSKSDVDDYVLWRSYSSIKDGIAIRSTVGSLIDSLDPSDKRAIYVTNVQYSDYETNHSFDLTNGKLNMIAPHSPKSATWKGCVNLCPKRESREVFP